MQDKVERVGEELKRLLKRKGLTYEEVLQALHKHANKTLPYEPPPYQDRSALTRVFNERVPSRPRLLYVLIWGIAANQDAINSVLTLADYETLSNKEIERLPPDQRSTREQDVPKSPAKRFVISLDGIIINSVGELLYSTKMTDTIKECRASYRRGLEDFAFALVYGSQIRSRLSKDEKVLRSKVEFGNELVRFLPNELYGPENLEPDCQKDSLFANPVDRERISDYISSMSVAMGDRQILTFCRDWLKREAKVEVGDHKSLFREGGGPDDYHFKKPYYLDGLLDHVPRLLGEPSLSTLIDFLPRSPEPGRDPYARTALRQFTVQNVLTHLTTMLEYQKNAERHKRWRMPYAFRSEILDRYAHTYQQRELRNIVVRHALLAALSEISRAEERQSLVAVLLEMRTRDQFKQIREMLEDLSLIVLENEPTQEQRADKLIHEIRNAGRGTLSLGDPVAFLYSSVIRTLASANSKDYEMKLCDIFPEFRV
jgi:transcriptional regulator with XRE-family HTH domain